MITAFNHITLAVKDIEKYFAYSSDGPKFAERNRTALGGRRVIKREILY